MTCTECLKSTLEYDILFNKYSKKRLSLSLLQVDGTQTLDENIADNDGLKKAFYVRSCII